MTPLFGSGLPATSAVKVLATTAAPTSGSPPSSPDAAHQPGTSPPLNTTELDNVDLEKSDKAKLDRRLSATGALATADAGASTATSSEPLPLRVDLSNIEPAGSDPAPRLSPENAMSINEAYAMGYLTPANEAADPLLLRSRVVNEQELRRRPSKGHFKDKKIKKHYEKQNALIENLLKPISKHASENEDEAEAASKMVC